MAKPEPRQDKHQDRETHDGDEHCILCEAVIEVSDHDVWFVSGYCQPCHEALEEE